MTNMMIIVWIAIGLLVAFALVNIYWRYASRRGSHPCPSWLAWSLEGRFVDWWTGTERTLDRIGLRPGERVLEVGPGPGRLLVPAAARVGRAGQVVGLDVQQGMIDRLKRRAAAVPNLTAVLGNAERMELDSASFDLVYLCAVLGEIPSREAALAECFRVLKPGGRLSISEMAGDPHFQSRSTVRRLAEAAGFRQIEVLGRWYKFTANFEKPA